jgi:hypothetical protein
MPEVHHVWTHLAMARLVGGTAPKNGAPDRMKRIASMLLNYVRLNESRIICVAACSYHLLHSKLGSGPIKLLAGMAIG